MKLKTGVKAQGLRPEMLLGIMAAQEVYRAHGFPVVITSLLDGTHSATSLHYSGCAVDLRTRHVPKSEQQQIRDEIKEALGEDYDVILESTHIHMEYQPRR